MTVPETIQAADTLARQAAGLHKQLCDQQADVCASAGPVLADLRRLPQRFADGIDWSRLDDETKRLIELAVRYASVDVALRDVQWVAVAAPCGSRRTGGFLPSVLRWACFWGGGHGR